MRKISRSLGGMLTTSLVSWQPPMALLSQFKILYNCGRKLNVSVGFIRRVVLMPPFSSPRLRCFRFLITPIQMRFSDTIVPIQQQPLVRYRLGFSVEATAGQFRSSLAMVVPLWPPNVAYRAMTSSRSIHKPISVPPFSLNNMSAARLALSLT